MRLPTLNQGELSLELQGFRPSPTSLSEFSDTAEIPELIFFLLLGPLSLCWHWDWNRLTI